MNFNHNLNSELSKQMINSGIISGGAFRPGQVIPQNQLSRFLNFLKNNDIELPHEYINHMFIYKKLKTKGAF